MHYSPVIHLLLVISSQQIGSPYPNLAKLTIDLVLNRQLNLSLLKDPRDKCGNSDIETLEIRRFSRYQGEEKTKEGYLGCGTAKEEES